MHIKHVRTHTRCRSCRASRPAEHECYHERDKVRPASGGSGGRGSGEDALERLWGRGSGGSDVRMEDQVLCVNAE